MVASGKTICRIGDGESSHLSTELVQCFAHLFGGELQIVLDAHGGHDEAHLARDLAAQRAHLVGKLGAVLVVDEREQSIAEAFGWPRLERQMRL